MRPDQIEAGKTYEGEVAIALKRKVYGIYSSEFDKEKILVGYDLITNNGGYVAHSCKTLEDFAAWAIREVG